jgi:hypothetical protein
MADNLLEILEDEWYLVRHSGETPEIALHSAIYFLTRAKSGPRVDLSEDYLDRLKEAAVERFSEIVLRDLQHANKGTSIYRGLGRSIINYRRFCTFCARQKVDPSEVRKRAADALQKFLVAELAGIQNGKQPTIINCSYGELNDYFAELGVDPGERLAIIAAFCLPEK